MEFLKPYKEFTSTINFPSDVDKISELCNKFRIKDYKINEDLSIDVEGDVNIDTYYFKYLPLNFNIVKGNFYCQRNKLVSLYGSPKEVGENFVCSDNKLETLKYAPTKVNGFFNCSDNKLTSFKYIPKNISVVNAGMNKITSFEYLPTELISLGINSNQIKTLEGLPNITNFLTIEYNPISYLLKNVLYNNNIDLINEFKEYHIIRDDTVVLNRLKAFYNDFNLPFPDMNNFIIKKHYKVI